jgi:fatty-acid desaturase
VALKSGKPSYEEIIAISLVHVIAALAAIPWFFSWTGVALLVAGIFVFGVLGINLCYHRLLTHRGFTCPLWLERTFATLAVCCMQESPPFWVAVHRRHHHHADDEHDPHSPLVSFFWAHVGWLVVRPDDMERKALIERYAKDIMRDPYYAWLERPLQWVWFALCTWAVFFAAGFFFVLLTGGTAMQALQFGLSLLIWGAALRTVVVWHITWSVNSVTHVWGYRNYDTPDVSRNNVLIGLLAAGEGWHNNHHADPRSARQGHKWWEFDLTWLLIRLLMRLGLARNVALPSPTLNAASSASAKQPQGAQAN